MDGFLIMISSLLKKTVTGAGTTADPTITKREYSRENEGYGKRKLFYKADGDGKCKFTLGFRLKHLFGFLQDFNRVIFNTKIELILTRKIDDKLVFYGKEDSAATLEIKTLELHVYEVSLEVVSEIKLIERLKSGNPIYVDYLERISGQMDLPEGTSYSTNIPPLSYLPRCIFIGFKDTVVSYKKIIR